MNPSDSLPDLTGELVDNGTLEILSRVGCGAYGHVYKARDTTSPSDEPRFYAVKCMRRHEHKSRADRLQRNELRVHKMASHSPHIVTFHRAFVSEEMTFVVLDYVPGDFFSALVDREIFRCKPTLIKKVFHEILDAVEFLHRNSIYHRDLKPENLLCDESGLHIRLADFGLSTQTDFSNEFGCGSRFYMSPESLDRTNPGGCYSARSSDIWALSIIFTNLISGRHPWSCAVMTDQGYAKFRSNNNYLYRALRLTREANALLKRCFEEDPRRRPTLAQLRTSVDEIMLFSVDDEAPSLSVPPAADYDEQATPRPGQPEVMQLPPAVEFTAYNVSCSSSASSSFSFVTKRVSSQSQSPATTSDVASALFGASDRNSDSSPPTTPASSSSCASMASADAPQLPIPTKQPSLASMIAGGSAKPPPLPPRRRLAAPYAEPEPEVVCKPEQVIKSGRGRLILPTRRAYLQSERRRRVREDVVLRILSRSASEGC